MPSPKEKPATGQMPAKVGKLAKAKKALPEIAGTPPINIKFTKNG